MDIDLIGQFTGEADPGDPHLRPVEVVSRQVMNANASLDTSRSGVTAATTSRERGPTTGKVTQCSVTEVTRTRSCGHSVCSHSSIQSRIAAAPPVVV